MSLGQSGGSLCCRFPRTPSRAPKLSLTCIGKRGSGAGQQQKHNQIIKRFDSYVDLSNNSNLPLENLTEDGALTLYWFSQFDIPNMRVEVVDATESGIHVLQATQTNQ